MPEALNTFTEGLITDVHPLMTPSNILTNCLNGTIITFNGNEFVLQNDMGNGRVETAFLPSGYVPIGVKEYGGIIYIASYNPLVQRSQLGCFPSPERNISSDELNDSNIDLDLNTFNWSNESDGFKVQSTTSLVFGDSIFNPGDQFVISIEDQQVNSNVTARTSVYFKNLLSRYGENLLKFFTIEIGMLDSNNKITVLDKLKLFKNPPDSDQFDRYIMPYFNSNMAQQGGTIELEQYRDLVSSNYNVYSESTSGKLCLIFTLEGVNDFNFMVNITTLDDGIYLNYITSSTKNTKDTHNRFPESNFGTELTQYTLPLENLLNGQSMGSQNEPIDTLTDINKVYNENLNGAELRAVDFKFTHTYKDTNGVTHIDKYPKSGEESDFQLTSWYTNTIGDFFLLTPTKNPPPGGQRPPMTSGFQMESVMPYGSTYDPYIEKVNIAEAPARLTNPFYEIKDDKLLMRFYHNLRFTKDSGFLDYSVIPVADTYKLNTLTSTGRIDFSRVNSGEISLDFYKYFVSENSMMLSYGLSYYPKFLHTMEAGYIEFYDIKSDISILYKLLNRVSWFGSFNLTIQLEDSLSPIRTGEAPDGMVCLNKTEENIYYNDGSNPLSLLKGTLYAIQFIFQLKNEVNDIITNLENPICRFMYTTKIFNEYYSGNTYTDFKDCKFYANLTTEYTTNPIKNLSSTTWEPNDHYYFEPGDVDPQKYTYDTIKSDDLFTQGNIYELYNSSGINTGIQLEVISVDSPGILREAILIDGTWDKFVNIAGDYTTADNLRVTITTRHPIRTTIEVIGKLDVNISDTIKVNTEIKNSDYYIGPFEKDAIQYSFNTVNPLLLSASSPLLPKVREKSSVDMKAKYDYLLENHKDTLKMITSINNNTLSLSSTDDSDVYRFMVGDIGLLEKSIETLENVIEPYWKWGDRTDLSTEEVKEINNRFLGVSLTNINGTRQPMFNGVVGYISREWAGVGKLAKIASDGTIPNGVDENNSTLKTDGIVQLISTQHVEHAKDSERVMSDEVKKYCDTNNQQYPSIILVYYQDFGDGTKNRLYYDPNNNYEFNENVIIPAFLNDVGNYTLLNHMWTLNNAIRAWGNDINSGIGPVLHTKFLLAMFKELFKYLYVGQLLNKSIKYHNSDNLLYSLIFNTQFTTTLNITQNPNLDMSPIGLFKYLYTPSNTLKSFEFDVIMGLITDRFINSFATQSLLNVPNSVEDINQYGYNYLAKLPNKLINLLYEFGNTLDVELKTTLFLNSAPSGDLTIYGILKSGLKVNYSINHPSFSPHQVPLNNESIYMRLDYTDSPNKDWRSRWVVSHNSTNEEYSSDTSYNTYSLSSIYRDQFVDVKNFKGVAPKLLTGQWAVHNNEPELNSHTLETLFANLESYGINTNRGGRLVVAELNLIGADVNLGATSSLGFKTSYQTSTPMLGITNRFIISGFSNKIELKASWTRSGSDLDPGIGGPTLWRGNSISYLKVAISRAQS